MSKNIKNKKKKNMNKKGLIASGIALALAGGLAFSYFRKNNEEEKQLQKKAEKDTSEVVQESEKELLTIEKAVENLEASRKNLIAASTVKTFQEKGKSDSNLLEFLIKLCNGSQAEVEDLCESFEDKPVQKELILDLYIKLQRDRDQVLRLTYEDRETESSFEIMSNTLNTITEVDDLLDGCGIIKINE